MRISMMLFMLAVTGVAPTGAAPPVLPVRDTGLGFYFNYEMGAGRAQETAYLKDMAARGCNTFTVYFRNPGDIARQLDGALEAGLLDSRFPVALINNSPQKTGAAVAEARKLGKRVAEWPVLYNYGPDEIPAGRREALQEWIRVDNVPPLPIVIASDGPATLEYADVVDWMMTIDHQATPEMAEAVRGLGHVWGAYTIAPHIKGAEDMVRYVTGLWAWKMRPTVLLAWCYHDTAEPVADGRLQGWQDGALDYRILLALEQAIAAHPDHPDHLEYIAARRWLEALKVKIVAPSTEWVGRPPTYGDPLAVNTQPPPVTNFGMIRQWAGHYLATLTGTENPW